MTPKHREAIARLGFEGWAKSPERVAEVRHLKFEAWSRLPDLNKHPELKRPKGEGKPAFWFEERLAKAERYGNFLSIPMR